MEGDADDGQRRRVKLRNVALRRGMNRHTAGLALFARVDHECKGYTYGATVQLTKKRLARTLLLLARYGGEDQPEKVLQKVSQETLAEMIGTTRSRVNLFMNKFTRERVVPIISASVS